MLESSFHMIDVGAKAATSRHAQAQGRIELSQAAFAAIRDKANPKGDVLALAEVAGLMSAKRTSDCLPLCHPLAIEKIGVSFALCPETSNQLPSVLVYCDVHVTAKTGVEMEALSGVNGALLCIYDLSKAVDPVLKICEIRLNFKRGGKSGEWFHPEYVSNGDEFSNPPPAQLPLAGLPLAGLPFALLTVSDRVSQGTAEDLSGKVMQQLLLDAGAQIVAHRTVSDDKSQIMQAYHSLMSETTAQVVLSTGGTGLSPRDVTPEALMASCDRLIPGFGELLRSKGAEHVKTSWLSRSVAGIKNDKILIALPGSPKAVKEGLEVLIPILRHGLHTLRGGSHELS